MNAALIGVTFLVLFGVIMIAISVGYRFLESQRKKQVEGMLDVIDEQHEQQPQILMDTGAVDPVEALLGKTKIVENLQKSIQQSGLNWSVSRLVASTLIAALIGALFGWVVRPLGFLYLSIVLFALLIGSIPWVFLRVKRSKRMAEFETQLPEALDFLARSMRAGHAFSISLEMLGQESPDPLGQEFRVLFNETNLGASIEVALENFAVRVPLLDIKLFVSSVLLQKQTGGNLSEILVRLSYIIRERFRLKGQVRAASAHGRLTAAVLSILPLVLIVALLFIAPGYLQSMAADPDGKWLILGAIVAQGMGYYIMRRIVDIKV